MTDKEILKKLVKFHDKTLDCLDQSRHGHTPNWQAVMDISDDIEDDSDLSEFRN